MSFTVWDRGDAALAVEMWQGGAYVDEIARAVGRTEDAVYSLLARKGQSAGTRKRTPPIRRGPGNKGLSRQMYMLVQEAERRSVAMGWSK